MSLNKFQKEMEGKEPYFPTKAKQPKLLAFKSYCGTLKPLVSKQSYQAFLVKSKINVLRK